MFHANGWTFTWINTARGMTHVCLRRVEPTLIFKLIKDENITMFCAAPTVLIGIANAPEEIRADAPRGVRLFTAGAPPAAATIEVIERDLGWDLTHVYGLTETAPLIAVCEMRPEHQNLPVEELAEIKSRQGVELVSSGELRVVDEDGNEVPHDGETLGEITVRGNVVMKGYYNDPEATNAAIKDGWFHSGDAAVVHPDGYGNPRPLQGCHHQRRRKYLVGRGRRLSVAPPRRSGKRCCRYAARKMGRVAARLYHPAGWRLGD
jgi:fatty-acyl-CoA synthase